MLKEFFLKLNSFSKWQKVSMILVVGFILLLTIFISQRRQLNKIEGSTNFARDYKDEVSKLILLPEEDPVIRKINNLKELKDKDNDFYKDVKEGDVMLIYPNLFIIYRPADNILIKVSPIVNN